MQVVRIPGAALEVDETGAGEPVLFVQTALTADELRPLADTLADEYRGVVYHRRGYAGSGPADGSGSIERDAADGESLLDALGIERAHVVGVSYSGAVAMQLAATARTRVHTLTLIEPPPVHTPSAEEFRAAVDELTRMRATHGTAATLDAFFTRLVGEGWQEDAEAQLPGSVAQMTRDVGTFLDHDLPALVAWQFGPDDARRVACPVLHVGGAASGTWFAEVRDLVLAWFPDVEDVRISGAGHTLALTHTTPVADAVRAFLRRHPMPRGTFSAP